LGHGRTSGRAESVQKKDNKSRKVGKGKREGRDFQSSSGERKRKESRGKKKVW